MGKEPLSNKAMKTELSDAERQWIRKRHTSWQDTGKMIAPSCMAHGFGNLVPWPCPVIRALDRMEELEVETAEFLARVKGGVR